MSWPAVVWNAPVLRGLDARARAEIEAAGALRRLQSGDRLFSAGDPADAFFVVTEGAVDVVLTGSVLRRAAKGDALGEEATLRAGATRALEAVCKDAGRVAEIPVHVFRRAAARSGGGKMAEKIERTLRRSATRDALRAAGFLESGLEALVDAARSRHLARGEKVEGLFAVGAGMLEKDGVHLLPGDLTRGGTALGPTWVLEIPSSRSILARADAVYARRKESQKEKTDLYRMRQARSLLVIDQASCVRCGHCAASCASAHDDGIARLVREGPTLGALLLAKSCHHCDQPTCMSDCPTGAITRGKSGEVLIKADLCIGCGNCAKGCPWGNIEMEGKRAVKCDQCGGGSPACVRACPVEAAVRVEATAIPEVAGMLDRAPAKPLPRKTPAWPFLLGAAVIAAPLAAMPWGKWTSGAVAGGLTILLLAYAALKRRFRVRPHFIAHLALGALSFGAVLSHGGASLAGGVAGALQIAFFACGLFGALAGLSYAIVPPLMARSEREAALPEALPHKLAEVEKKTFRELTGKPDAIKLLYARILRPYARSVVPPGAWREEEARLLARVRAISPTIDAGALIALAVEERCLRAQRWLGALLRAWVPLHAIAAATVFVLLAGHVFLAWRYR